MDKNSTDRLSKVHPLLADAVIAVVADLSLAGRDVRIVQGFRTADEQNMLYAQGRTRSGPIVTNAKAWQSNHSFGLAVDCCPFRAGKPDWNDIAGFKAIGVAAKKHGLEWGGDWKKFTDLPHVQLKGLTLDQCRTLFKRGGLEAVWDEVKTISAAPAIPTRPEPSQIINEDKPPATPPPTIHKVVSGDTLSGIARKYKTTVEAIQRKNGLRSTVIRIGEALEI